MSQEPSDHGEFRVGPPREVRTAFTTDRPRQLIDGAEWRRRRWGWKQSLWAGVAVVGLAVFWLWAEFHGTHSNSLTAWRAEMMVSADLPDGSTQAQVEAWLTAHGIAYGRSKPFYAIQLNDAYPELKTLPIDSEVDGWIPDANVSLILPGRISLDFFFDKDGKLLKHIVRGEEQNILP